MSRPEISLVVLLVQYFLVPGGSSSAYSSSDIPKGVIAGRVVDAETKKPLVGANVMVVEMQSGASTDLHGNFVILDVPVGNYTLRSAYIGYSPFIQVDTIVKPLRTTFVSVELTPAMLVSEEVTVTAGYFPQIQGQPASAISFSFEEIRRSPGSAGDVSRIIMGLPSIAKVADNVNSLVVRGGSPTENCFFVDNIETPNINHYPTQGSSDGPIGLINVDFIQEVNFYTGGFSAIYGDKLSSVMDLTLREGNRDEFDGQLDLNFGGYGAILEGPLSSKKGLSKSTAKGSWLFSARRSFLALLVDAIGTGVAPRYSDYQGKVVYDLTPSTRITALNLAGVDEIGTDKEQARDLGQIAYGDADLVENTFGINLRHLWNKSAYSNTSISHTLMKNKTDFVETVTDRTLGKNNSVEQSFNLRNVNYQKLSPKSRIEFGMEAKHLSTKYDNFYAEYTSALGDVTPELTVDSEIATNKMAAFVSYLWRPFGRLTVTLGARGDYFSYTKRSYISPRFSLSYKIDQATSINGATGVFRQDLPLIILYQRPENRKLKAPRAYHYVVGLDRLLAADTKLTLELYDKEYSYFPLDPAQPQLFILDELFYRYGFFFNHERLDDRGKAFSRGVELLIQKKLARNIYGLVGGAYFKTEYRDYDDNWRDRVSDNRYIFSVEGGYKPNSRWEFSMRWIYAGGRPYTPFDIDASKAINKAVFDRSRVNETRYPDYHSLNVRLDRRFNFSRSNLVLYFSVWNAYNRKNVSSYYWNEIKNTPGTYHQWNLLPVFGLEYEF